MCPAAIPSAAGKVRMTPEGRPANELLVNAEASTQRGLNNGSVEGEEEEEEQRVLRETNHHVGFWRPGALEWS